MTSSKVTRRSLLALAGIGVVAACSSGGEDRGGRPSTAPASPSVASRTPPPVGEPMQVRVAQCAPAAKVFEAQIQGRAEPARCRGRDWFFELPATDQPTDRRRSEVWLTRPGGGHEYRVGDRAAIELLVRGSFGAAADTQEDWQSLWQLHGPTGAIWKGPAVALIVRQGGWFLGGGTGHPQHDDATHDYRWEQRLGAYRDGVWQRLRIAVSLSPDPVRGVIDAALDGGATISGYRPVSTTGLMPGTLYPGQPVVSSRIGIYRGTLFGAPAPTYAQSVEASVQRLW